LLINEEDFLILNMLIGGLLIWFERNSSNHAKNKSWRA